MHLESLSFRTLSDPLLSTFSYTVDSADTTRLKFGGRPLPLPPPGSPFRDFETVVKPAWLALPEASPEALSTSGASSCVSTSSNGEVGSWSVRREKVAVRVGAALPLPPPSIATKLLLGLEAFEFDDLARATRDFVPECCMEQGDFEAVYRAWLNNPGCELAVVRLNFDENQAIGRSTDAHGAFRDYQIDAVTLNMFASGDLESSTYQLNLFTRFGRLVEGVMRSVNNLLEKFHQSFFLYLLCSPSKFVSVGLYMIPLGLLLVTLPLGAAALNSTR